MKKLFFAFILLLSCIATMAQSPINIGIHGGTSSNRIRFNDLTNIHGSRPDQGFMLGGFMRINFKKLYIEPAVNFSLKKSIAEGNRTEAGYDRPEYTLKNNAISIPVMLGVQLIDLQAAKIRFFFGPQVAIGKIKHLGEISDEIDAHRCNWSGKIGLGLDIWKLTFDIDYENGFQKMAHELKAPRSYNFTLGLKII